MADVRGNDELAQHDLWTSLLVELDRPLTPGFMTAGYTALGRYIFLATCTEEPDAAHRPLFGPRLTSSAA